MNNLLRRKLNNETYEILLIIILLPIISFSLYKYGYLDYSKSLVNLGASLKVLWLLLINILITFIINLFNRKDKIYSYYEVILLTLLLPIRVPYYVDVIGVIGYNLSRKYLRKYRFNTVAIFKLLCTLGLIFLNKNNYLSYYQENIISIYKTSDLIMGASIGSLGSNNLIILLICYCLLSLLPIYKKDIPYYALISYSISLGIYGLINNNLIALVKLTLNSTVIFSFIFLSTINISSPINKKIKRIYGLLIGIFSFIFLQINPYDAGVIGIVISNLICNFIYEFILN